VIQRKFRGDPNLEFAHIALCTWADEIRGGLPKTKSALAAAMQGTSDRATEFSEQSAQVDYLVCHAQERHHTVITWYYQFGRPMEAICRRLRLAPRGYYLLMESAREYVMEGLYASGFRARK
jgi:hypothetical protein